MHNMTDGVLSLFGSPGYNVILAQGQILKGSEFKPASINVVGKGMLVAKALGREELGNREDGKASVSSSSRWLYRGNSLISQTVLQSLPISKPAGVWKRSVLELAADILSGLNVKSVLDPWIDGLSAEECNKIMLEVGNRDWSLAVDIFSFLRVRGPYKQADCPYTSEITEENDSNLSLKVFGGNARGLLKAYTTLIGILGRSGRMTELAVLLSEMDDDLEPDVRFYNAVAEAYSNVGLVENVYEVVAQMERKGLQPDSTTHELIISTSLRAKIPQLDEALRVFRDMLGKNLEVGVKTYLKLIDASVDAGDLEAGEEVFTAMQSTSHQIYAKVFSPPYLKRLASKRDLENTGLKLYCATWVKMIYLHAKMGGSKKAEEHLRSMRASGVLPTSSIYDALLLAYCRAGLIDQAFSVFREYKLALKPSLVAYNYLIDASGKRGRYEETMALYSELSGSGLRPSTATYTSVICAMVEAGKFEKADRMYKKMLRNKHIPSGHTVTVMLQAYVSSGWTRLGHEVCAKLKDFNIEATPVIYGSILKLYVQGRWYNEVARVMREMESKQLEPDVAGYGVLIAALGEGEEETTPFVNAMRSSNWEACRIASVLVFSQFGEQDGPEIGRGTMFGEAWSFLDKLARTKDRDTNLSFHNALMDALWRRGLRRRAQLVMKRGRDLLSWYNRPRVGSNSVLDLRGLSVGGALVAMIDWLQEIAANAEPKETRHLVVIYTGSLQMRSGKSFKGKGVGAVRQAVTAYLEELCSPFVDAQESGKGKLHAEFDLVVGWVSKTDNEEVLQLLDFK